MSADIPTTREEALMAAMKAEFGSDHPFFWPTVARAKPRAFNWSLRRTERRINAALATVGLGPIDDGFRAIYWRERAFGQGVNEDAGGFGLRCWLVACGLDVPAPISADAAIAALTGGKP